VANVAISDRDLGQGSKKILIEARCLKLMPEAGVKGGVPER